MVEERAKRAVTARGARMRAPVAAGRKTAKGTARRRPSIAVRRAAFLDALRHTGIVSKAARAAGIASSTLYQHRARSRGFAADWDAALAGALDDLEAALLARARDGVEKPVLFQGKVVGSVTTYSDALAMFLLKAKRPEVYDRIGRAVAAAGDGEAMSEDEAREAVFRRLDRLAGAGFAGADGGAAAADGADDGDDAA